MATRCASLLFSPATDLTSAGRHPEPGRQHDSEPEERHLHRDHRRNGAGCLHLHGSGRRTAECHGLRGADYDHGNHGAESGGGQQWPVAARTARVATHRIPGFVANGETICVRHIAAGSLSTLTSTELTVGGISDTFTSTTVVDKPLPGSSAMDPWSLLLLAPLLGYRRRAGVPVGAPSGAIDRRA